MQKGHRAVLCALAVSVLVPLARSEEFTVSRSHFSVRAELEGRYDDNITYLSDRDRDRVGDPAFADRYKIEDPGDYVWVPAARLGWSFKLAKRVTTSMQLDAKAYRYSVNTIKNYETFGLRVAQDLSAAKLFQTRLIVDASDTPDYYLRELRVAGTTRYDSARFSSREYGVSLEQVLVPKLLDASVYGTRTRRSYEAPFHERSGDLTGYGADLELGPPGRLAGLHVGYEKSRYDARGDDGSTPFPEPDISSDRSQLSARAAIRWALGYVTLSGSRELRDYTSDEPTDIYHFDREDTRTEYGLGLHQGLPAGLFLEVALSREENEARLAPGVPETLANDVTDYTDNVVSASVGWHFRSGSRGGTKVTEGRNP